MTKIPLGRTKQIGVTPFKWGLYVHLRWNLRWWHTKCGFWRQNGLRLTTRRQESFGRSRKHVQTLRFNVSYWSSRKGVQKEKKRAFGFQVYWG